MNTNQMVEQVDGIEPCGHYVLVEVVEFLEKTVGGIIMDSNTVKAESKGRDMATIISFGPTAFKGFSGCDSPEDWGVAVGDVVQLNSRYDSITPRMHEYLDEYKDLRVIPDSTIISGYKIKKKGGK